ncbi:MAG: YraN family protein [Firmicutes bacterium]|nr:YraN family protein [Bacillota bacterium]MCL2255900.1 YraN family protein [Bacillota bacterium]
MRDKNIIKGKSGEKIAEKYLKKKGYHILYKNFKTNIGELDLVVTDDNYLVFVEVKSRENTNFSHAMESVSYHKRNKINQVAAQYMKKFMLFGSNIRFDVIEVYFETGEINHVENAFDSYLRY